MEKSTEFKGAEGPNEYMYDIREYGQGVYHLSLRPRRLQEKVFPDQLPHALAAWLEKNPTLVVTGMARHEHAGDKIGLLVTVARCSQ